MRSRAPFSAQLSVFHQNMTCSMHTFPSRIESYWMRHLIINADSPHSAFGYLVNFRIFVDHREYPVNQVGVCRDDHDPRDDAQKYSGDSTTIR